MSLRQLRSFTAEMMKLAADIQDADIRGLLAFRRGEEYLEGGKLPANTALEESELHLTKAAYDSGIGLAASGSYDMKSKTKEDNAYQKARDYSASGVKGGLTGLGLLGAVNAMRGRFGSPQGISEVRKAMKNARRAASVGASAAVVDRAYRHDELPEVAKIANFVNPTPNAFRSPAAQLSQARATGSFKNVVRSSEGRQPHSLQMGKKFRVS